MKIQPNETRIDGQWEKLGDRIVADAACERIRFLTENYLVKIATDATGWDSLYRDPQDGRLWERLYLRGEMHGGGPPSLVCVDRKDVEDKYNLRDLT